MRDLTEVLKGPSECFIKHILVVSKARADTFIAIQPKKWNEVKESLSKAIYEIPQSKNCED